MYRTLRWRPSCMLFWRWRIVVLGPRLTCVWLSSGRFAPPPLNSSSSAFTQSAGWCQKQKPTMTSLQHLWPKRMGHVSTSVFCSRHAAVNGRPTLKHCHCFKPRTRIQDIVVKAPMTRIGYFATKLIVRVCGIFVRELGHNSFGRTPKFPQRQPPA